MNNPTSNNKGIREEFNKIGEGSVRFMATRDKVFDFFTSHFSSELQALEEKVEQMDYRDFEKGEQFITKDEVFTLIKELKEKYENKNT